MNAPTTPASAPAGLSAAFDAKALATALATASKVTPWAAPNWSVGVDEKSRAGPPLVEISGTAGAAVVRSANFDRQLSVELPYEGDSLRIVIPLPQLLSWLERLPAGVRCEVVTTDDGVLIRAARNRLTLRAWPATRYVAKRDPGGAEFETSAAALAAGVSATIAVPREDALQPARGGVLIHGSATALGFMAADEHRIHELTTAGADDIRLIIPRDAARLVGDVFEGREGLATVRADDRSAAFSICGITISTALIDAPAVLSDEQFERDVPYVLTARAHTLLADLELIATVADPRNRDFTLGLGERCRAEASSNGAFGGRSSGEVLLDTTWDGPDLTIMFALRPVRDALLTFGESEIQWRMNGSRDPTIITAPEVPDRRALVAPFLPTGDAVARAA